MTLGSRLANSDTASHFPLSTCSYDVGSVGGAALLMREDLGWTKWQVGFFVGSINFFCIAGALNAGLVCDSIGRRRTFTASCAVFITGILIQVLSSRQVAVEPEPWKLDTFMGSCLIK